PGPPGDRRAARPVRAQAGRHRRADARQPVQAGADDEGAAGRLQRRAAVPGQHPAAGPLLRRRPADQPDRPHGPRRRRARALLPAGRQRARIQDRRAAAPDLLGGIVMAAPPAAFELPDTMTALPRRPFQFSTAAIAEADVIVAQPPEALFRRLLADQESEAAQLAARRVLDAFLSEPAPGAALDRDATADDIAAHVSQVRQDLAATVATLTSTEQATRELVIRQRALLGLLGGCWLDVLSQPATQPSVIVNRLFAQHYTLRGAGNPRRSLAARRRQAMEAAGVFLPDLAAADFAGRAGTRPLTALHGCWYLALSRLPASFVPELAGVHYAVLALGVDDMLAGQPPLLAEPELRAVLAAYLDLAGPAERSRLHNGLRVALDLEREHVAMLAELAGWHAGLTLESKVD